MKITLSNSKLGGFIPQLNLPAGKTCAANVPCKKGCYALRGNFGYDKIKGCYEQNLKDFLDDSDKFFDDIISYLRNGDIIYKYFRWFSSGDIVNMDFLYGMIKVAKACPETKFLCFTKKFTLVNMFMAVAPKKLPKNLNIVFSGWDKSFKIDNPFNFPTTYVKFKDKTRNYIPSNANECPGKCHSCKQCWDLKSGEAVYFKYH